MSLDNIGGIIGAITSGMHGVKKSTIGDLEVDAITSRTTNFTSEVSEYPVEDGFPISDHVTRKPLTLSMEVICTPSPVDGTAGLLSILGAANERKNNAANTMYGVANKIQEIYKRGEPVTIRTPDSIYHNMVMTHAPLARKVEDGICYRLQLEFTQVRIVTPKTATVGDDVKGKTGTSEVNAGSAMTHDIGTGVEMINNEPIIAMDSTEAGLNVAGLITSGMAQRATAAAFDAYAAYKSTIRKGVIVH